MLSTGAAILVVASCVVFAHAQNTVPTTTGNPPGRTYEMKKDDLILMNVAAKGRVVELLANELARTEIVRALLVEYARECVENITVLEKHCLDCMIDRCNNRMSECHIKGPPLSEIISHDPSPIRGLQFLTKSPRQVDKNMRNFANSARTDILQGVPETLREQSEAIMHSEVDQSLDDLNENMNTERALQKISLHVQKAADNVNRLPDIGDKLGTIIVENEDQAINIAELLARRLKKSRPFFESISHNGGRVMEQMPDVIDQVGDRVKVFKEKVSGVFSKVLNTFQKIMDDPDTPVTNGNQQQQQQLSRMQQAFSQNAMPNNQQIPGLNQLQQQQLALNLGGQFPQGQQLQGQRLAQQMQFQQNGGQGQWNLPPNHINHQQQQQQAIQNSQNQLGTNQQFNQVPFPNTQGQGQNVGGRRRRHTDPDCKRLEGDPDTYCRTYESVCHNCTLEKRLRFEVCGEGVEKARDEIKSIDSSVESYLENYEEYVADGPLVLKVELNTANRLHKTNSFFDAHVTAKIGSSIFRYQTKMILNTDDIRSTGLQVGDELWEKLWENKVFTETERPELVHVPDSVNIMGQVHIQKAHKAHAHKSPTGSASSTSKWWTCATVVAVSLFTLVL